MRTFPFLPLALLLASAAIAQNPYVRSGVNLSIASDLRARNVGDILTVTVQEQTSVKNQDKVERSNDTSLAVRL